MADFFIPQVSPSIHENVFSNETGDRTLTEIQETLGAARRACEAARAGALALLGDESQPMGQRHVRAAQHADKCMTPIFPAFDRMQTKLAAEMSALEKKTGAPAPTRELLSGEIRKRLSEMPEAERMATILRTIRESDDLLAAAVLSAPAFLSGLTAAQFEQTKETWRRTRLGDDCARLDLLAKRELDLQRAAALCIGFQTKCADQAMVQATKESAKRAAAALAAANAGLQLH
jgi:hypothetical protein